MAYTWVVLLHPSLFSFARLFLSIEHCIFALNTFVLPILSQQEMLGYHMMIVLMIVLYCVLIGALLPCADQVIGMHYFSPLEKMPLLEINFIYIVTSCQLTTGQSYT